MKMDYMFIISLAISFSLAVATTNKAISQTVNETDELAEIVKKKIKHDAIEQDSNLILFTMPLYVNENSLKRKDPRKMPDIDHFVKSTRFCYSKGFNLRFYVLSSKKYHNDARLEIYRSGKFDKIPDVINQAEVKFFHEVIDPSADLDVSWFDYPLRYPEEFKLLFSLTRKEAGCAVVIVTVYPQKKRTD
ncbi:MAG: hypothetical protein AAGU19_10415 [Prolixibacteraceae bacterium]